MTKRLKNPAKTMLLTALLLVGFTFLPALGHALELKAQSARPYGDNPITVTCEEGGRLTLQGFQGTRELEPPVEPLEIEAGKTELTWRATTWYGEPLLRGKARLRATLTKPDGTTEEAEISVNIGRPHAVAVACSPETETFFADGKRLLKIECVLAQTGICQLDITRRDDPDTLIWQGKAYAPDGMVAFQWAGRNREKQLCEPGEYVITAYSQGWPDQTVSTAVTLLAEDPGECPLAVTGPLLPEDLTDDAAVWQAITAPIVVGQGPEGRGLPIYEKQENKMVKIASISCATVGVTVLALPNERGWVRVGVWRQGSSEYTEGFVQAENLKTVRPNTRYGALLDKKAQTLTVYEDGKKVGSLQVSTGLEKKGRVAETCSGAYLLGNRLLSFVNTRFTYLYPFRIDGGNLIHSLGYKVLGGEANFGEQIGTLGQKASHGCVRMDVRGERGLTAWWIWTHMGRNMKILITDDH